MQSLFLALLLFGQTSETPQERTQAITFLLTLQTSSGGFIERKAKAGEPISQPSLRTTQTALRAFRIREGSSADRKSVIRYLKACHDPKSGGFSDRPGLTADPISTSMALLALIELNLSTDPYRDGALKFIGKNALAYEDIRTVAAALEAVDRKAPEAGTWLALMHQGRNTDGSYGIGPARVRATALQVVADIRLGNRPDSHDGVFKILRAGQHADGGFSGDNQGRSDSEVCYRVMHAFSLLEAVPDRVQELHQFIASCRNADGGYGVKPDEPSTVQGTYYAEAVRHFAAGGN
jgi:prenyltransferase beta subunit